MRRPTAVLLRVVLAAVVATGCARSAPSAGEEQPRAVASPTPPPVLVGPLTGIDLDEPSPVRPVLAIKIDNAPLALPPLGLDVAEVVIEEEVEGGITRFIALYHDTDPGLVGPVRSGREVDADLLPAFQPIVALSGGAPSVRKLLERAGLTVRSERTRDEGFSRDPDRPAPHNLFADSTALWELDHDLPQPREPVWDFAKDVPEGGSATVRADLEFSPATSAGWSWSADDDEWQRDQNGAEHVAENGERIAADNVVIMRVESRPGDRTDSSGARTLTLDVVGEGEAVVLRDGQAFQARWHKGSAEEQVRWLDADGNPLPLRPGRTWVELLETAAGLDISAG